jgi:hypothetical protein
MLKRIEHAQKERNEHLRRCSFYVFRGMSAFIEHPGGIRILTHCLELAAIPRRRNGNG